MDLQLVVRAQRGDQDAYEHLARASANRLHAIAYQITRDPDRADDAVQQPLVAMWRELPSLRDPARFEAWTYRLVTRACLKDLRGRRRIALVAVEDRVATEPRDHASDAATRDQLERALATLTPDHRAVIVLRHLTGLPLTEIAEVLGIPYGTVASRLHQATQNLRAAIEAGDRESGDRRTAGMTDLSLDRVLEAWPRRSGWAAVPAVPSPRLLLAAVLVALALAATALAVGARLLRQDHPPLTMLEPGGNLPGQAWRPQVKALPDGRVLITGELGGPVGWLFDAGTKVTKTVSATIDAVHVQDSALLTDGRVVLLGWADTDPQGSFGWMYDPRTGALSDRVPTLHARNHARVAPFADGRVLVVGGYEDPESLRFVASDEIFDPLAGRFLEGGSLGVLGTADDALAIPGGDVAIVGRALQVPPDPGEVPPIQSGIAPPVPDAPPVIVVRLDASAGELRAAGVVGASRRTIGDTPLSALSLAPGRILVISASRDQCGRHGIDGVPAVLYDPAGDSVVPAPALPHAVETAVALPDGRVVVAGSWTAIPGGCADGGGQYVTDAWLGIYDPTTGQTIESRNPITGAGDLPVDPELRYTGGALLPDGRAVLISYDDGGNAPSAIDLLTIAPQHQGGGR